MVSLGDGLLQSYPGVIECFTGIVSHYDKYFALPYKLLQMPTLPGLPN